MLEGQRGFVAQALLRARRQRPLLLAEATGGRAAEVVERSRCGSDLSGEGRGAPTTSDPAWRGSGAAMRMEARKTGAAGGRRTGLTDGSAGGKGRRRNAEGKTRTGGGRREGRRAGSHDGRRLPLTGFLGVEKR